jgi:hypothetical protein
MALPPLELFSLRRGCLVAGRPLLVSAETSPNLFKPCTEPPLALCIPQFYYRLLPLQSNSHPSRSQGHEAAHLKAVLRAIRLRPPLRTMKGVQMSPHRLHSRNHFARHIALYLGLTLLATIASAQTSQSGDLIIGVTYVCNGEHIYIEGCNVRDLSDTATCMVAHPDHLTPTGLNTYTSMTRGDLKKLLPTCQQPSSKQVAAAQAFQKRQQDLYNANVAKATAPTNASSPGAQPQSASYGQPTPPKSPEERELRRCVSSGRLPASCTGNQLLGAFGQMLNSFVQITKGPPPPGANMAGVFVGAGNWRLDFIDEGVLVNCSFLSPNQENYSLAFKDNRAILTIATTPKPLILAVRSDGTITGPPGPVVIDGVVAGGSSGGGTTPGHYETQQVTNHQEMTALEAQTHAGESGLSDKGGGVYDLATNSTKTTYVPGTTTAPQTNFIPKRATCPSINLSTKGAGVGVQTMQTDLLKSVFNDGDKGPPTPPGIRMHGIFAASTGFSLEFFPESVILGCGPDAARAYPYTVIADGTRSEVKIDAPDHPLTFALKPDGSLDPNFSSAYQVHGRIVTGQDNNDNYVFSPMERTCDLAVLTPSKTIPTGGGTTATMVASATNPGAHTSAAAANPGTLSTPATPLGNATLTIVSGFTTQPGAPNPLAGHPYILLRDNYTDVIAKGGITVPPGVSPYKFVGMACVNHTPDCQKGSDAVKANAISAIRADANGNGTLPGVPPGTYYLMISTRYNNQPLVWGQAVQLKPGANTIKLDQTNATPLN